MTSIKNTASKLVSLHSSLRTQSPGRNESDDNPAPGSISVWNLVNLINSENHEKETQARQKFTLALSRKERSLLRMLIE